MSIGQIDNLGSKSLLLIGVFAALLAGAAIGMGLYVVLPLILLPVVFVVSLSLVDVDSCRACLRYVGAFTVASMILWPRYSYIRIGGLPGVTPSRLLALFFVFLFVVVIAKSKKIRSDFIRAVADSGVVGWVLLVYLLFRVLSVVFSKDPLPSLFVTVNELIFFGLFFALSAWILRSKTDALHLVRLLAVATIVVALVVVLEYKRQQNVFAGVLPVSDDYAAQALANKVRDSGYRVQATFDHPLTFAQYLVTVIPLMVIGFFRSTGFWVRIFWGVCCSSALVSVVLSGSRSVFVVLFVSLAFLCFILLLRDFVAKRTTIGGVLVAISGLAVLVLVVAVLSDKILPLLAGRTASEVASSTARLHMLHRAIPLVLDSPLFGYGVGRAAELVGYVGAGGILTIDSLPISIVVESGVVALVCFFFVIGLGVWKAFQSMKIGSEKFPISAGFAAALVAFGVSMMTLSLTSNMFVLAVVISGALASTRGAEA